MEAVNVEVIDVNKGRVTIVSATEPASLSITGADVDGLRDGYVLAAGSVIVTPSKTYIAFADGEFIERTSGGDAPTPSSTVIFDGNVEWTYNQESGMYMAKIDTQSEILLYSELDVTVNGENYVGYYTSQDSPMIDVGDDVSIAHAVDVPDMEDGWYIIVYAESEPSASLRIVQNPMEWTLFYSGDVTTVYDSESGMNFGYFERANDYLGEAPVRGMIDGNAVTGTFFGVENESNIEFAEDYVISTSDNVHWSFSAPTAKTYSLNIEYLVIPNTELTT